MKRSLFDELKEKARHRLDERKRIKEEERKIHDEARKIHNDEYLKEKKVQVEKEAIEKAKAKARPMSEKLAGLADGAGKILDSVAGPAGKEQNKDERKEELNKQLGL